MEPSFKDKYVFIPELIAGKTSEIKFRFLRAEISFIRTYLSYTIIFFINRKPLICAWTLKTAKENFSEFDLINESYLVNLNCCRGYKIKRDLYIYMEHFPLTE